MIKFIFIMALVCLPIHADDLSQTPEFIEIHGDGMYTVSEQSQGSKKADALQKKWEKYGMVSWAKDANLAVKTVMRIGIMNLHRKGFHTEARDVELRWKKIDGLLIKYAQDYESDSRKITDFEPWNKELAMLYLILEAKLTYPTAYALRLTDLATYLWTPPVVFHPCDKGEQEFFYHFAHDLDGHYRSFAPTTAYWLTVLGCNIATYGAGYFFICSPASMLVEKIVDAKVAPWLSPKIYARACTKED